MKDNRKNKKPIIKRKKDIKKKNSKINIDKEIEEIKKATKRGNENLTDSTKIVTEEATIKIPIVSDDTKMYKFTEDEIKNAELEGKSYKGSNNMKPKNKGNKKTKKKNKKKMNIILTIIKKLIIIIIILGILGALIIAGIIAGIFLGFFGSDFKMTKADLTIEFINSEVYDADGNLLCTLNGNEKRKIVSLQDMPEYLPKAYVAIEDERFYEHNGVDIKRTGAATVTFITHAGNSSFGGSTITQQLVKNITDEDEDSAMRKIKEMARAIQVEKEISKDDILELYLNVIFVGGDNINGVALGSEYYFNKNVKDLTVAEAAYLAGINHTPNSYNPFYGKTEEQKQEHIKMGHARTKVVLGKMKQLGYISQEQYDSAIEEVNNGLPFAQGSMSSGVIYTAHTEAALKQIVEQMMEEKGMSKDMAETKVYGGGYKIYTTQVTSIQNTMQEEMSKDKYIISGRKKNADGSLVNEQSQAAMVIIEPSTGKVVGCVGKLGAKTTNGDLNRATQSARQVGSAMKPISVVGPAVQEGIVAPASVYEDKQTSEFTGKPWPKNYDNRYLGKQTVRETIKISHNIIPVRILKELGVGKSIEYLNKMGLTGVDESVGLTLALGSKEFTTLQMAAAYATIANDGVYISPTFYNKVVDSNGETVIEPNQTKTEVFGKSEDFLIKSIVTEPVVGSGGTATYCAISGMDVAAKTGTTDSDYDRWLCGFTPYYAAACWYGYDINEEVIYKKATPTNPAGGIWSAVMKQIHTGLEGKRFEVPANVIKATVCHDSGLLPSGNCSRKVTDYFIDTRVPKTRCGVASTAKQYAICEESGLLAIDGACTKVIKKSYSDGEEIPSTFCNIHKVAPAPSASPSASPSAPAATTSAPPKPAESAKPSTAPAPSSSTAPAPSSSSTPAQSAPAPSTKPAAAGT